MFDNLQLIPGEAFTATGKFAEALLDKVSNAIGYAVISKNAKNYRLEAEEYFIESIKNDDKMPPLAKAASISNARKIIKEYSNKCAIFEMATNYLNGKNCFEKVESLEDDWLECFFSKAKDVSREDMQIVWAQLLAKEIQNPDSVSKQLLHILSVIDYDLAVAFQKLSNFTILIENDPHVIILLNRFDELYSVHGIKQADIINLEDIGLLQQNLVGFAVEAKAATKIQYFDWNVEIEMSTPISVGNVVLSKAGEELMSIISDRTKIEGFDKFLQEFICSKEEI